VRGRAPSLRFLDRLAPEITATTLRAGQESCGAVPGCMFGNLALELGNSRSAVIRGRLQEIFEVQAEMIAEVVNVARERGDVRVGDVAEAVRSIVAQVEGHVMFVKFYNDVGRMDSLWVNCAALSNAGDSALSA